MLVCLCVFGSGCDAGTDGDTSDSEIGEDGGDAMIQCELVDTLALVDADEVAPNGKAGAEILAAVPDSFLTTLHWDLSNSRVEVEVEGTVGQSSSLELGFTLAADPVFVFEDWAAMNSQGEVVSEGEVVCEDYVRTSLDLTAHTMDGALSIALPSVDVRLGPDYPEFGILAEPFILKTAQLASPEVAFVSPVVQPADNDKTVALIFEGEGVSGTITAYATVGDDVHQIVVSRW
ncbi:hypothetical protein G6O69_35925 [Pseudenhygromyxa sp. WMMC2535]|uniref:hypothetical protein n=1 Tax=Pseudenhygromyxa sp. WMMC2535 TaxID=2712867 RepID=UPI0015531DB8|nr:hypothetical protein [Pseudenhygromyxa sp. WMMC2535]NVB43269.1 hypothetical protein [Pseudenhygromyxa sp. WMMC2535]